jgi:hypothetical protein
MGGCCSREPEFRYCSSFDLLSVAVTVERLICC